MKGGTCPCPIILSLSKTQVIKGVSPGPSLPKEKEPTLYGDIVWDRFLLRQFGPLPYRFFS
jgi:hypothetical protein